jgi:hypothetical protein
MPTGRYSRDQVVARHIRDPGIDEDLRAIERSDDFSDSGTSVWARQSVISSTDSRPSGSNLTGGAGWWQQATRQPRNCASASRWSAGRLFDTTSVLRRSSAARRAREPRGDFLRKGDGQLSLLRRLSMGSG